MSLVNVSIVGNIVKPPEQRIFDGGRMKTTLVMAIKTPNKQDINHVDFYKIETWGKLAEVAHKYVAKGSQVGVTGRLSFEHWTDKQQNSRFTPVVKADQLSLPPKNRSGDADSDGIQQPVNPIQGELTVDDNAVTPPNVAGVAQMFDGPQPATESHISLGGDPDEEFNEFDEAIAGCPTRSGIG